MLLAYVDELGSVALSFILSLASIIADNSGLLVAGFPLGFGPMGGTVPPQWGGILPKFMGGDGGGQKFSTPLRGA